MELIQNKKAGFNYQITETLSVGIELTGQEVKAIRVKKANLTGALVKIYGGQLWLVGATIGPYQEKNAPSGFDPQRPRRLLAHKKEISSLVGKISQGGGLTLIPLKLYNNKGKIKLEIGIGKIRKKADKREIIRKREDQRKIRKHLLK